MRDAFTRLAEIAAALPPEHWLLIGGLMVHAHAELAGVPYTRPTDDADLVVELRAVSYAGAADRLASLGYRLREPLDLRSPLHRYVREDEVVDLMAPEGATVRYRLRQVLTVPGSRSALNRAIDYALPSGTRIRIPDVASALSLKGAALHTPGATRERHAQDAVTLLACASPGAIELSKSMQSNVNKAIRALDTPEAWSYAAPGTRRRAVRTIQALRPDWQAPQFVFPQRFDRKP